MIFDLNPFQTLIAAGILAAGLAPLLRDLIPWLQGTPGRYRLAAAITFGLSGFLFAIPELFNNDNLELPVLLVIIFLFAIAYPGILEYAGNLAQQIEGRINDRH